MLFKTISRFWWLAVGTVLFLTVAAGGCSFVTGTPEGDGPVDTGQTKDSDPSYDLGASEFLSADQQSVSGDYRGMDPYATGVEEDMAADDGSKDEKTVEEGDIYRVLSGSKILNLNNYRGLQIIDFSDVSDPQIIGRFAITGTPVELYVIGETALVLLNNWYGYYGSREDVAVEHKQGGVAVLVDISDPTAPFEISRSFVPGNILTSRLTRQGELAALYVVANYSGYEVQEGGAWDWYNTAYVKSFEIVENALEDRSEIDLGGYVQDIQATTNVLMVANYDWSWDTGTQVTVFDISNPEGLIVQGDTVTTSGRVETKFNMSMYGGVLRVVSDSLWGADNENHLETWDATDLADLKTVDHCAFGANEDLFATLFLGEKAFFVTYFRQDPFHAFHIDEAGMCQEKSEFIVSGWNDFFRAVLDETRLIGIGVDDQDGWNMAVSLYDITDLANPSPLIEREEVEASGSWSQARWDDKAFSVLEDAVSVSEPGGAIETGLVLLPFQGWNEARSKYEYSVQIYTFSADTLTRRGVMDHGTPVVRSFLADEETCANLSQDEMSLFDNSNPDAPVELGRVELTANYTNVFIFGDHYARLKSPDYYWYWAEDGTDDPTPQSLVQIIPRSEDPDAGEPVASIEIDAGAQLIQAGMRLLALTSEYKPDSKDSYFYETTIEVYDLDDPTDPTLEGTVVTDRLQPYWGGYYYDDMMMAPSYYGGQHYRAVAVDNAVVFVDVVYQSEITGHEEYCSYSPNWEDQCYSVAHADGTTLGDRCYQGQVSCHSKEGASGYCEGSIYECTIDDDGQWYGNCEEVEDYLSLPLDKYCHEYDVYRGWQKYNLHVLPLGLDELRLANPIEMPKNEEAVGLVPGETSVYYNYKMPHNQPGQLRPFVKYYFKEIDLKNPLSPVVSDEVNIPGTLLKVRDKLIFTRDDVWSANNIETSINKLILKDGLAYRIAVYPFEDRWVQAVHIDDQGDVLVVHRPGYMGYYYYYDASNYKSALTILDDFNLRKLSEIEVDSWATLMDAKDAKALFSVPGGLLVINFEKPYQPFAQAYFPTIGWPSQILLDQGEIIFAAGRYGIYRFDANTFNLLSP